MNALLPGYLKHCIPHPDFQLSFRTACLLDNVLERTNSHLKFNFKEEEWGLKCWADMGLKQGSKFICFHGRDSSYLNSVYPGAEIIWRIKSVEKYSSIKFNHKFGLIFEGVIGFMAISLILIEVFHKYF